MMKLLVLTVLCALVFTHHISVAQQSDCCRGHSTSPTGGCTLLSDQERTEIPFNMVHNHILLPVRINSSEPLDLILDTGMPVEGVILFDCQNVRDLGLKLTGRAISPGEECEGEPNLAMGITLELPGVKLTDQMVSILPPLSKYGEVGGVIGLALFSRFVVEIDHNRKKVILHRTDGYAYEGSGKEIPLSFNQHGIPEVRCEAVMQGGKKVPLQLVVDTGAGHALSLNVGAHEDIHVPEKSLACSLGRTVYGEVSSAGESHPHALSEPCMNVSAHTAPIIQPKV